MKLIFSILVLIFSTTYSFGQYWLGPKIGFSYIDYNYQDGEYEKTYKVVKDWNYQVGLALNYTASERYSIYTELVYERIGKKVTDIATNGSTVRTSMTNHFISLPAMLRITFGKAPIHYYINGGLRLSYWLGGSGSQFLDEFIEQQLAERDYNIVFNRDKVSGNTAFIAEPNRLQFGLTVGGGIFFDIQGGTRLMIDARYTWVHNNMGSNSGTEDENFHFASYQENFEYSHNIATIGIAYLFNYDQNLIRKGKSTIGESNKR